VSTSASKHVIRAFSDGWRQHLEAFLTTGPHSIGPQTTRLLILDVHRTALNRDGSLNRRMVDYAGEQVAQGYELVFLSYDPNDQRMSRNYRLLNKCELYRGRKKLFVKKRKKYAIIHTIDQIIFRGAVAEHERDQQARLLLHKQRFHMIFIDDNHNNVDNIDHRLLNSTLTTYYSAPSPREHGV
jgi:hypothetical protein